MWKKTYHWRLNPLTDLYELWVEDGPRMFAFGWVVVEIGDRGKKELLYRLFDAQPYAFFQEV